MAEERLEKGEVFSSHSFIQMILNFLMDFPTTFFGQKVAYPHPRDCSKYYVCDVNGTVSWKIIIILTMIL